jgi:hypothetical protein
MAMKEEELSEYLQKVLKSLRQSSEKLDCDIADALYYADSAEDFQGRVSNEMDKLISDIKRVKKMVTNGKEKDVTMPGMMTVEDAQQIAFETLRSVAILSGWENFKDLVGRELDITDGMIDSAVDLLFSDENITCVYADNC